MATHVIAKQSHDACRWSQAKAQYFRQDKRDTSRGVATLDSGFVTPEHKFETHLTKTFDSLLFFARFSHLQPAAVVFIDISSSRIEGAELSRFLYSS